MEPATVSKKFFGHHSRRNLTSSQVLHERPLLRQCQVIPHRDEDRACPGCWYVHEL
jgi:hypothetical protein